MIRCARRRDAASHPAISDRMRSAGGRGRFRRTTLRKLGDHGVPETVRSHDHARRVCPRARCQSPDVCRACVGVVIAFGLWPSTRPARSATTASVCQSTSASRSARRRAIAGRMMLITQLAMCTVLLIGAGLLLRTVTNLRSQELGFDRNVLIVPISPGQAGYSEQASAMLIERLRERLSAVPASKPLACRDRLSSTTPTTGLTARSS